jgi:hypothetical protein
MICRILWLAVIAILWVGCARKEQSSEPPLQPSAGTEKAAASDTPPETAPAPAPVDAPAPSAPTRISVAGGGDATAPLTTALRRWSIAHKRAPKDFEEFSDGMQIPPPPAGIRYSIDKHMRVVLVAQ